MLLISVKVSTVYGDNFVTIRINLSRCMYKVTQYHSNNSENANRKCFRLMPRFWRYFNDEHFYRTEDKINRRVGKLCCIEGIYVCLSRWSHACFASLNSRFVSSVALRTDLHTFIYTNDVRNRNF